MGILIKRLAIRIATSQLYVEYTDDTFSSSSSSSSSSTSSSVNNGNLSTKIMHQIITLQPEAKSLNPPVLAQRLREAYPHLFPIYIDDSKLLPLLRSLCGSSSVGTDASFSLSTSYPLGVVSSSSSSSSMSFNHSLQPTQSPSPPSSRSSNGGGIINTYTGDDKYLPVSPSNNRPAVSALPSYRNGSSSTTSSASSFPSSPLSPTVSGSSPSSTAKGTGIVNRGVSYASPPSTTAMANSNVGYYPSSNNSSSSSSSSSTTTTTNVIPTVIANIGDLQKVGPAALQIAKAKMDIVFEANKVRPGDDTFVYDKRADFVPSEESDWD